MSRVYPVCFLAILALISGCSQIPKIIEPEQSVPLVIEGFVIRNELVYPVTDVMINVPATGNFAGCGNILPRSACSIIFPDVVYRSNAIVISWKEYGSPHATDEFVVDVPADLLPDQPARLEVVIFAKGQAGALLVQ